MYIYSSVSLNNIKYFYQYCLHFLYVIRALFLLESHFFLSFLWPLKSLLILPSILTQIGKWVQEHPITSHMIFRICLCIHIMTTWRKLLLEMVTLYLLLIQVHIIISSLLFSKKFFEFLICKFFLTISKFCHQNNVSVEFF